MTRPLPEDVARTARAYLAALVPPDEVSDAWHELVADVTYWGEHDLVGVVRLAHQVALQHQPVTPEVAVLALREVGVARPGDLARVLDVDEARAQRWAGEVAAAVDGVPVADTAVTDHADPPRSRSTDERDPRPTARDRGPDAAEEIEESRAETAEKARAGAGESAPAGGAAVRIGFDDDGPLAPLPDLDDETSAVPRRRGPVVAAVAVVALVLALWLLLGR